MLFQFVKRQRWVWITLFIGLLSGLLLVFTAFGQTAGQRSFLPVILGGVTQPGQDIWHDVDEQQLAGVQAERRIFPPDYRVMAADMARLTAVLSEADAGNEAILALPLPDGRISRFRLSPTVVMAPELAARYPQIRTFNGASLDDPGAIARLDVTPHGFHAMLLMVGETIFIDPYSRADAHHYLVYSARDYTRPAGEMNQLTEYLEVDPAIAAEIARLVALGVEATGDELRTYRLAIAASGEYTAFHGGTVASALAEIVTAVNRVTGIYEREVAVRLVLIANNDQIIYTDAGADPYTNDDADALLNENQANLDAVIGSGNYDIGHVFTTGSGGLASLGVTCRAGVKARGTTGLANPVGDPFYVDYVAHEIGHQFGGNHTFNGTTGSCAGNRNAGTAFEPGSGSTIMAYAGICSPQNLQGNSDDYFHTASYDEIVAYTTAGSGNSCPVVTATGNSIPSANAGGNFTIPRDTPFVLSGSGSDPNAGDVLTFNWEEMDLGPAGPPDNPTQPPYFRSWPSQPTPVRFLPRLSDLVNNTTAVGEVLPTVGGTLNFRLTVRDNALNGGGVDYDGMQVTVDGGSGPFRVTNPNTAVTWVVGQTQPVTWDVAGSDGAPVNCSNVRLSLSRDGGFTYPVTLNASTANDGSENITVPNTPTLDGRVQVACVGNIFFDISNTDFSLLPRADAGGPYTTDEGVDVTLDASGSSAADSYAWDFDNDGFFDDAVGLNPNFDLVGQDGVYIVRLRVTKDGVSNTDSTTVTVHNVPPTVTLASDSPQDENTAVTVTGLVSDPGWLEALTATIDWGDGTAVEPVVGVLENVRPDATLTFTMTHIYGDNGVFTVEVCGSDDDTTVCETTAVTINNVDPTLTIDASNATIINGQPVIIGQINEPVAFNGQATDPGSDDLLLSWDWDDGPPVPDVSTLYLVNPPNPDPFPSPTIQPRDVTDSQSQTYSDACLYTVQFLGEDDDGGTAVDDILVIIVGDADRPRHDGYWQHQFRRNGNTDFDDETLLCYLEIIDLVSNVFNEVRDASTIPAAFDVLFLGQNRGSEQQKFDRELITVWLNFANGALAYDQEFDIDHDGAPDGTLAEIVAAAEAVRLDPNASDAALRVQRLILHRLSNPNS
ncbi:MAG TPA: M12 family metallo-peptidase [Chloroflexota bacterium]|nr:M12 family metallo-peptidase [Chloroflexota bacterium]